jgi:hypothetical protein
VENENEVLSESLDLPLDITLPSGEEDSLPQVKSVHREPSAAFAEFLKEMEGKVSAEEKVRCSMEFMKNSLVNPMAPRFRDFWDARRYCLPLFKEQMSAKIRGDLWQEYVDLSTEARRLKEILDEQSAFAYEQIDLAIQALAKDLEGYDDLKAQVVALQIPSNCSTMLENVEQYQEMQRNLHLLNAFASKINSLRKEVIRTEMRIKNKNKLFEKLSSAGDSVFPKRKLMIKQISELFTADVSSFVKKYFVTESESLPPLHQLREEIKALQTIAKDMTLNAQSFTETRLKLSECWDKLKVLDKERKKEFSQKRQQLRQNVDQVLEKIKAFEEYCKELPSINDATVKFEEVLSYMKTIDLSYPEQKMLKDELFNARKPVWDKQRNEQIERETKEKEVENLKKQKIDDFRSALDELLTSADSTAFEMMIEKRDRLLEEYSQLNISKADKMLFDRSFKQLKDVIDEKKSENLLSLSDSDKERLNELVALLAERKKRRLEIKSQIEIYRKVLGGSGFDFEKAMMYRELIEAEKAALEKINLTIEEIEEKVAEIEG